MPLRASLALQHPSVSHSWDEEKACKNVCVPGLAVSRAGSAPLGREPIVEQPHWLLEVETDLFGAVKMVPDGDLILAL